MCAPSFRMVVNDCWVLDGDHHKFNHKLGSCDDVKEDLVLSTKDYSYNNKNDATCLLRLLKNMDVWRYASSTPLLEN